MCFLLPAERGILFIHNGMTAIISHIQENIMDTNLKMSLFSTVVALAVIIIFGFTAVLN